MIFFTPSRHEIRIQLAATQPVVTSAASMVNSLPYPPDAGTGGSDLETQVHLRTVSRNLKRHTKTIGFLSLWLLFLLFGFPHPRPRNSFPLTMAFRFLPILMTGRNEC
jgi:hypothetical protein